MRRGQELLDQLQTDAPTTEQQQVVRAQAERDVLDIVNAMIHNSLDDASTIGSNFFLAVTQRPHVVAERALSYDRDQDQVRVCLYEAVMKTGRNAGEALGIPDALRREAPVDWIYGETADQREERLKEYKVRYLTGKYFQAAGIESPNSDTIEKSKELISNQLDQTDQQWEEIIARKADHIVTDTEAYGEVTAHMARIIAEEEVLDIVNTIGETAFTDIDEIGFGYLKVTLEDPIGVARELRSIANADPSLAIEDAAALLERDVICPAVSPQQETVVDEQIPEEELGFAYDADAELTEEATEAPTQNPRPPGYRDFSTLFDPYRDELDGLDGID